MESTVEKPGPDLGWDGRRDGAGDCDAVATGTPQNRPGTSDRAIITVTLCGTLVAATLGILYLMAIGRNVNIEATLAVAAGWYKLVEKLK